MVVRKVKARTAVEARRKAKNKWPGRKITGVRLYKNQKKSKDGKKEYRVLSRKKESKKSKYMPRAAHARKGTKKRTRGKMLRSLHNPYRKKHTSSTQPYLGRRIH